jgi:hypothetical protein
MPLASARSSQRRSAAAVRTGGMVDDRFAGCRRIDRNANINERMTA